MAGSTPHADSATDADPDFGYHLFNTVAGQQVVVSLAYIALFLLLYRTVVLLFPLTTSASVPRTVTLAIALPPSLATAEPVPGAWPTTLNAHPQPEPASLQLSPSRRDPPTGLKRGATAARATWVTSISHEARQASHYWAALIPRLSCALALTHVLMEMVLLFVTLWVCNYFDVVMYATTLPTALPLMTRRASLPLTWLPVFSWQDLWTTELLTLFWHYQVVGTLATIGIILPFTYFFAGTDPTATLPSRCREAALVTFLVQILHGILVAVFTVGFLGLPPQLSELWLLHTWLCAVTVPIALWLISRGLVVWWTTLRSLCLRLDHPQQMQLKLDVVVCHIHALQRELDQLHWRQRRNLVQDRWESAVLGSQNGFARPSFSAALFQRLRRRRSRLAALGSLDPLAIRAGSSTIIRSRLGALRTEEPITDHLDDSPISTERPAAMASSEPKSAVRRFNPMGPYASQHQRTKSAETQALNEPPRLGKRKPSDNHQQHVALKVGKLHAFSPLLGPLNDAHHATPLHRPYFNATGSIYRHQAAPQTNSHTLATTTTELASAYASYRTLRGLAARHPWRWNLVFCVMILTTAAACTVLGFWSAKSAVWGVLNVEPDLGLWSHWGMSPLPIGHVGRFDNSASTTLTNNQWLNLTMDYARALNPREEATANIATNSLSLARAWTTAAHWYHVWWDDWVAPSTASPTDNDQGTEPPTPALTFPFPFPLQATGCPQASMVDLPPSHDQVHALALPFASSAVPLGVISPGLPFQPAITARKQAKGDPIKPVGSSRQEPPSPRVAYWALIRLDLHQGVLWAFVILTVLHTLPTLVRLLGLVAPSVWQQASAPLGTSVWDGLRSSATIQGLCGWFYVLQKSLSDWYSLSDSSAPWYHVGSAMATKGMTQLTDILMTMGYSLWSFRGIVLVRRATVRLVGWSITLLFHIIPRWYDWVRAGWDQMQSLPDYSPNLLVRFGQGWRSLLAIWWGLLAWGSRQSPPSTGHIDPPPLSVSVTPASSWEQCMPVQPPFFPHNRQTRSAEAWCLWPTVHAAVESSAVHVFSNTSSSMSSWETPTPDSANAISPRPPLIPVDMTPFDPADEDDALDDDRDHPWTHYLHSRGYERRAAWATWWEWKAMQWQYAYHQQAAPAHQAWALASKGLPLITGTPWVFPIVSTHTCPATALALQCPIDHAHFGTTLDQYCRVCPGAACDLCGTACTWGQWLEYQQLWPPMQIWHYGRTWLRKWTRRPHHMVQAIRPALSFKALSFSWLTSGVRGQPTSPPPTHSIHLAITPLIPVPPTPPSPPPPTYYQWAFANRTLTPATLSQQQMYYYYYHLAYYQTYLTQSMDQLLGLKQPPASFLVNATGTPMEELWCQLFRDSAFAWDQPKSVWVFWWAWWSAYHYHHSLQSDPALDLASTTDRGPTLQTAADPGMGWQFMELLFGPPDPTRTWRRWAEQSAMWSADPLYVQVPESLDWGRAQPDPDAHAWRHRWDAWQRTWWRPACFASSAVTPARSANAGPATAAPSHGPATRAVIPAWLTPPPPCPPLPPTLTQPLLEQEPLNNHAMHPLFRLSVVLLRAGLFLLLTYQTVVRGVTVFLH
ncbi:hypothetical protein H4R35_001519 [Dimargaris xerosporica]|nr:hypothetical protein H4R35_001519 [Dimargaris xerosporica]